MFLLASLMLAFVFDALTTATNTAETVTIISASVAGIIGAILAARQKQKPKTSKPKPKQPKVVNTLSQADVDEIGARR